MAQSKNKRLSKGKKGQKKKVVDALARKEWFTLTAPQPFKSSNIGWTCINKSTGLKKAQDGLKGRVVETTFGQLQNNIQLSWRKVRLIVDDVEGKNAKTTFYGLDMTRDKNASLIEKWATLIETVVEAKSKDGYLLRVFLMAVTKRSDNGQIRKTSYAQTSQIKLIRKQIGEKVAKIIQTNDITTIVSRLTNQDLNRILHDSNKIYPLKNFIVKKVKVLQRPKIDATKLQELYTAPAKVAPAKKDDTV